jgi:hypothetical protein
MALKLQAKDNDQAHYQLFEFLLSIIWIFVIYYLQNSHLELYTINCLYNNYSEQMVKEFEKQIVQKFQFN